MNLTQILSKAKKPKTEIKSTVVRVDKAFCSNVIADLNKKNRPHSKSLSTLYANEMLRGKWATNGEPLIFGIDGEEAHLVSGQHRLHALLMVHQELELKGADKWPNAQTEIDMCIVYNVDMDTADTVDTGNSRSHADVLFRDATIDAIIPKEWNVSAAKRKTWTKTLAGAARLVWLIEGGATVSSAPKFLISEMLDFLKKHYKLHDFVTMILDAKDGDGGHGGLKMSLPYLAALCYVASLNTSWEDNDDIPEIDAAKADDLKMFISHLAVGSGFDKGSPQHALTGYWNQLMTQPGTKDRDREWVGPFIKAVKTFFASETNLKVSDVKLTKKESDNYTDFPVMFEGWHTWCFENTASIKAAAKHASEKAEAEKHGPVDSEALADSDSWSEEDGPADDWLPEEVIAPPEPVKAPKPKPIKKAPVKKKPAANVAGQDL